MKQFRAIAEGLFLVSFMGSLPFTVLRVAQTLPLRDKIPF